MWSVSSCDPVSHDGVTCERVEAGGDQREGSQVVPGTVLCVPCWLGQMDQSADPSTTRLVRSVALDQLQCRAVLCLGRANRPVPWASPTGMTNLDTSSLI